MPKFSLRGPRDWRLRGRKNLARLTAPEQPTNLIGVGSRYLHSPVSRGPKRLLLRVPAVAMAHLRQAVAKTTVMVADGEAEAEAEADYERRFVELAQLGSPKGAAPTRAWAEAGAAE